MTILDCFGTIILVLELVKEMQKEITKMKLTITREKVISTLAENLEFLKKKIKITNFTCRSQSDF